MTSIELEDRTVQALRAQAEARNLPLDKFLQQLAAMSMPLNAEPGLQAVELDSLIASEAGNHPPLPKLFSRAEIYDDHN